MKSYTFCLYYEVQDSSNEDIDGFKKDNAFESGYSPIIFKSIEEAMSFRENPDFSMISNKYLDKETKYWNIRVFENKSAESPRNEETAQTVTKEIARLLHALKLAQSELNNINKKYYGDPVKEQVFNIIAEAIVPFER